MAPLEVRLKRVRGKSVSRARAKINHISAENALNILDGDRTIGNARPRIDMAVRRSNALSARRAFDTGQILERTDMLEAGGLEQGAHLGGLIVAMLDQQMCAFS